MTRWTDRGVNEWPDTGVTDWSALPEALDWELNGSEKRKH